MVRYSVNNLAGSDQYRLFGASADDILCLRLLLGGPGKERRVKPPDVFLWVQEAARTVQPLIKSSVVRHPGKTSACLHWIYTSGVDLISGIPLRLLLVEFPTHPASNDYSNKHRTYGRDSGEFNRRSVTAQYLRKTDHS